MYELVEVYLLLIDSTDVAPHGYAASYTTAKLVQRRQEVRR